MSRKVKAHSALCALALFLMAIPAAAASGSGALAIAFGERSVAVTGAGRGHQIIAFGIGIGRHGGSELLTREARALADEDGDGIVEFRVRHLPPRSVWVAVDLEDGSYTIEAPDGAEPAALVIPPDAWRGNTLHLDLDRPWLEALVVRRGVGAWTMRLSDGGANDGDGRRDGVSRLRLDRMTPLTGEEKGPPFAAPRDLIVLVDPHTLELFASEAR